jgi:hypothetical protein
MVANIEEIFPVLPAVAGGPETGTAREYRTVARRGAATA